MLKPLLITGAVIGAGLGGYYYYQRKKNQATDLRRLQITLGGFRSPRIRQGFLFLPVDLSINNPTSSDIDLQGLDLKIWAEINLQQGANSRSLFAGEVDLTATQLPAHKIVQVRVDLQAPLLNTVVASLQAAVPGLINVFIKEDERKIKTQPASLEIKLTPRLRFYEMEAISFQIPLSQIMQN